MSDDYTYRLSPAEFTATQEKIAKIQARVEKRGFTGGLVVEGEFVTETTTDPLTGIEITEIFVDTKITGTAPSYEGWTFAARVDAVGDTFTLATAPGVEYISRDHVKVNTCEHCGTVRNRKSIFLVRNDATGAIVNVGSTCIKDFLGWDAQPVFLSHEDVKREISSGFGSGERSYSVDTILAIAYASIRTYGWVASSSYEGRPTASDVWLVLSPTGRERREDRERIASLRPAIEAADVKVEDIKAYILSDAFSGQSTFIDNMKVAVTLPFVTGRQVGILAYAPQALIKHNEGEAARKVREERVSEFQGNVGDKITVTGTIESIRYIPGNYGTTVLYTVVTPLGLVKWFASREALGEAEGVEVTLTGTVKKHEEFRGTKATVLTRCKQV